MLRIGSHISSAKGYAAMGEAAWEIGANTLQFFLRNPRGGRAKAMNPADVDVFNKFAKSHDIRPILAHASYVLNPATADKKLEKFVFETMTDDMERMEYTPGNLYNIHPGRKTEDGVDAAVGRVAGMFDRILRAGQRTTLLIETMVGHGSELGGRFEELRAIIDASKCKRRLGVCLDTCHVFAGGYDIVNDLDAVLEHFDKVIGFKRLKAVHLNDSMFGLGERKDRHARLGEGKIGWKAIGRIVNHPALRELPFYLETPNEPDGYAREIAELKKLYKA